MSQTIFPFQGNIHQSDRHCLNGHRSALVWFTGLSGSGKSTLAHAPEERLFNSGILNPNAPKTQNPKPKTAVPMCPGWRQYPRWVEQ